MRQLCSGEYFAGFVVGAQFECEGRSILEPGIFDSYVANVRRPGTYIDHPEWTAARRAFPELPLIVFVTPTSTSDGMKLVQAFFGDSSSCAATKHLQTHKVSLESIQALPVDANVVIIYYTKLHGGHFGKMTPLSPDDQRNRVKLEAAKRAEKVGTYIRLISLLLFSPASSTPLRRS